MYNITNISEKRWWWGGENIHFLTLINARVINIICSPQNNEKCSIPVSTNIYTLFSCEEFPPNTVYEPYSTMAQKRNCLTCVKIDEKTF